MNEKMMMQAIAAKTASYRLAASDEQVRNLALQFIAEGLSSARDEVFSANQEDLTAGIDLPEQIRKRLLFDQHKLEDVLHGLQDLVHLPDPVGQETLHTELAPGLRLRRVTCPIGVIGVIFESRPDALVQIASLCLKSGNAVILKGGSEAARTNQILFEIIKRESARAGLPEDWISLLTSREEVGEMLAMDEQIDLIIPRGSNAFVRHIMENTKIPVLGHSSGLCHVYIDRDADPEMAARIAVDSKTQYPAACNAAETLLVHEDAKEAFCTAAQALHEAGVILRADAEAGKILSESGIASEKMTEADRSREYGDLIMNVVMVPGIEDAVAYINTNGSHHTDVIVTESRSSADYFAAMVDSAGVYHNCSSRFADGYRYGFGAEVGISTGKIHARGPMGLEGLCSYKYLLEGNGDCVADFASGARQFTHVKL